MKIEELRQTVKILNDYLQNERLNIRLIKVMVETIYDYANDEQEPKIVELRTIEDLGLTIRTENCLRRNGITTIYELTQFTFDSLLKIKNLGKKSHKEIVYQLHKCGFHLLGE